MRGQGTDGSSSGTARREVVLFGALAVVAVTGQGAHGMSGVVAALSGVSLGVVSSGGGVVVVPAVPVVVSVVRLVVPVALVVRGPADGALLRDFRILRGLVASVVVVSVSRFSVAPSLAVGGVVAAAVAVAEDGPEGMSGVVVVRAVGSSSGTARREVVLFGVLAVVVVAGQGTHGMSGGVVTVAGRETHGMSGVVVVRVVGSSCGTARREGVFLGVLAVVAVVGQETDGMSGGVVTVAGQETDGMSGVAALSGVSFASGLSSVSFLAKHEGGSCPQTARRAMRKGPAHTMSPPQPHGAKSRSGTATRGQSDGCPAARWIRFAGRAQSLVWIWHPVPIPHLVQS